MTWILVILHTVKLPLTDVIFETGILLVGDDEHAAKLRRRLSASGDDQQSPRDRLDAALDRIDDHLDDGDTGVPATGEAEDDG